MDAAGSVRRRGHLPQGRTSSLTPARLLGSLAEVPEDEPVAAAGKVAGMRPAVLRRLLRLAAQPGVARLLDRLG
ncbi:MAG TPA: hypothetical protein VES19_12260 [Candidatus Limnocylindrales bacterium]|nr:hypothetical protein [Candidatus Limnocylindrales bacterium]